ncbi:GGDEF domain-containing protein [Noviherbaspirillum agri]
MPREPVLQEDEVLPQFEPDRSFWMRRKKFPPRMEAAFQAEMDRWREQRAVKNGLIAVLLYSAFAISDFFMVPDIYQQAWTIRFLLVIPLMLLCTFTVYKIGQPAWREAVLAATSVLAGISLAWIAGLSTHPNAPHYQTGITLIILFGNIVLSLRFRSALLSSVLMAAVYAFMLLRVPAVLPEVRFNYWLFSFSAVVISLVANYRMDQDQRRAYIARAREQTRNAELSHAVELLAKLSAEDALTHIANRREFDRRLDVEWSRARRDRHPLALIMIDVDQFKNFNDHYGHPAGDACLQQIAAALRSIVKRPADLVARFGGEEFVALLPATSLEDATEVAEYMRQAVIDLQIPHATSRVAPGITASFGVAVIHPFMHEESAELVAAADAALYDAKEHGRNRVAVHAPATPDAAVSRMLH